jgi:hypothetical protein
MTKPKNTCEMCSSFFLHLTHGANAYKYQAKVHYLPYFVTNKRDLVYKEGEGKGLLEQVTYMGLKFPNINTCI